MQAVGGACAARAYGYSELFALLQQRVGELQMLVGTHSQGAGTFCKAGREHGTDEGMGVKTVLR